MPVELFVGFFGSEDIAERPGVDGGVVFVASQELVKERWRDPRFELHPSSNVDSSELGVERCGIGDIGARPAVIVCHKALVLTSGGVVGLGQRRFAVGSVAVVEGGVVEGSDRRCHHADGHRQACPFLH